MCNDLRQLRDKDLFKAYEKTLKRLGKKATETKRIDILIMASNSQAQQFYISPYWAMHTVPAILRGEDPNIKSPYRKELVIEIARRYKKLKQEKPDIPMMEAMEKIINTPAPQFYLSPKSVKIIFHNILKKKRNNTL